jgi:hypothetical protein
MKLKIIKLKCHCDFLCYQVSLFFFKWVVINYKLFVYIFIIVDSNYYHTNTKLITIHILVIQNYGLFHEPVLVVTPLEEHGYCSSQM